MGLTVSKATPLSLTLVYAVEQLTSSWGKGCVFHNESFCDVNSKITSWCALPPRHDISKQRSDAEPPLGEP